MSDWVPAHAPLRLLCLCVSTFVCPLDDGADQRECASMQSFGGARGLHALCSTRDAVPVRGLDIFPALSYLPCSLLVFCLPAAAGGDAHRAVTLQLPLWERLRTTHGSGTGGDAGLGAGYRALLLVSHVALVGGM